MKSCNCKTGAENTGVPFCVDIYQRTDQVIFQSIYDADGNKNSIKDSDFVNGELPAQYISDMINHADPSKRWYVLPKVKNVVWEQADANTEDIEGVPYVTSKGNIAGSFDLIDQYASDKYYGILESFTCGRYGMIPVTVAGELVGIEGVDELFPQPIEQRTMWLKKFNRTKTTVNKIMVSFIYRDNFPIGDINFIQADKIEAGALDGLNGLQDIILESSAAATTTSVTVDATLCYGGFENKLLVEGLVADDFNYDGVATVYNVTTDSSVAVSGVVESPEGTYVLSFAAQTSADVIQVRVVKTGFYSESIDITIP